MAKKTRKKRSKPDKIKVLEKERTVLAEQQTALSKERTVLAEEQTILSKERTVLSYMQTGLALIVAGIAVYNFFPNPPTQIVGWVLILFGLYELFESVRRLIRYKKKMEKVKRKLGREAP